MPSRIFCGNPANNTPNLATPLPYHKREIIIVFIGFSYYQVVGLPGSRPHLPHRYICCLPSIDIPAPIEIHILRKHRFPHGSKNVRVPTTVASVKLYAPLP
jgi:hypothetical protein